MGKISIDELDQYISSNNSTNKAKFFGLKNHGDSAIVRILHQSKADLDINVIHSVKIDGKDKKISCLRKASEPVANCPLCQAGEKVQVRTYVHLLVYRTDEQGNQVISHEVFDRGRDYIEKISNLAETYPPLYDTVFKIVRNGKAGDTNTTYDFMPLPTQTFNNTNYPYTQEDLSYEPALGTIIWDKSKEDLDYFVRNGKFPEEGEEAKPTSSVPNNQPVPNAQPNMTYNQPSYNQVPNYGGYAPSNDFPVGPRKRV